MDGTSGHLPLEGLDCVQTLSCKVNWCCLQSRLLVREDSRGEGDNPLPPSISAPLRDTQGQQRSPKHDQWLLEGEGPKQVLQTGAGPGLHGAPAQPRTHPWAQQLRTWRAWSRASFFLLEMHCWLLGSICKRLKEFPHLGQLQEPRRWQHLDWEPYQGDFGTIAVPRWSQNSVPITAGQWCHNPRCPPPQMKLLGCSRTSADPRRVVAERLGIFPPCRPSGSFPAPGWLTLSACSLSLRGTHQRRQEKHGKEAAAGGSQSLEKALPPPSHQHSKWQRGMALESPQRCPPCPPPVPHARTAHRAGGPGAPGRTRLSICPQAPSPSPASRLPSWAPSPPASSCPMAVNDKTDDMCFRLDLI